MRPRFEDVEDMVNAQSSDLLGDSLSWTRDGATVTVRGFLSEAGDETFGGVGIDPMPKRWGVSVDAAELERVGLTHTPDRRDRISNRKLDGPHVPGTVSRIGLRFVFALQRASTP